MNIDIKLYRVVRLALEKPLCITESLCASPLGAESLIWYNIIKQTKGAQTMMNKGIFALGALVLCVILSAFFFPFSQPQTTEDCAITLIEPITKPQKGIFPNEVPYEIIPVVYIPTPNDELTSAPQTTEESEA